MLADHCMAINDEGTKLIVYGGRLETNVFSSQLFILDISSRTWSSGPAGALPRSYMACTFAGDQFIVWGGIHSMTQVANSEAEIFSLKSNTWIKQYTPPASYQSLVVAGIPGATGARPSATATGDKPPGPSSSNETGEDKSTSGGSSIGGIVGGVVGGLAVVGAIIGFLIYRRREARGQSHDTLYTKANTNPDKSATAETSDYPPGHGHGQGFGGGSGGNDVGTYDEPRPFIAASPQQHTAGASVVSPVPKHQQSPQLLNPGPGTPGLTNQTYQESTQGLQGQPVAGSSA
ncbi:hypothetical protein BGX24_006901, partial [Mortierella sp. AD032]